MAKKAAQKKDDAINVKSERHIEVAAAHLFQPKEELRVELGTFNGGGRFTLKLVHVDDGIYKDALHFYDVSLDEVQRLGMKLVQVASEMKVAVETKE